jgi:hypothetical protein
MIRRRDLQTLNMSFLDTICNAFGALILLLAFSELSPSASLEHSDQPLDGVIVRREQELNEILGDTEKAEQRRDAVASEVDAKMLRVAELRGAVEKSRAVVTNDERDTKVSSVLVGELTEAKEKLSDEMQRLLSSYKPPPHEYKIGGIPVDSEYVIFVIDTSGSMRQYQWQRVMQELSQTLDVYPRLKGIQVMNDDGEYMFKSYRNQWIPDSPALRKSILDGMKNWNAFSNSAPQEGLVEAIHDFYDPKKSISVYYFGDDFASGTINPVVREIDRENHAKEGAGGRRVRIHCVAFPTYYEVTGGQLLTAAKFATLMRVICERNGGTFIALPARRDADPDSTGPRRSNRKSGTTA